jgi:uncharacterized membrane protein YphA (DoxX/SURF4 family)
MFIATVIVSAALAAVLVLSARGKLVHDPRQMKTLAKVGFPEDRAWLLASAELAGAAGLLVGLFWWPLAAAAAVGIIAYFLGATGSHMHVRDWQVMAPTVLLGTAVAALVLRLLSS